LKKERAGGREERGLVIGTSPVELFVAPSPNHLRGRKSRNEGEETRGKKKLRVKELHLVVRMEGISLHLAHRKTHRAKKGKEET